MVCVLLLAPGIALSDTYTFTAIPADVAGPPGSTVGWGYSISNQSATDWLVVTALNTLPGSSFDQGVPGGGIFDYPVVAPGATVSLDFDPILLTGLYEFTWNATAPVGLVDNGFFDLSGEWWSGDPLAGGSFLSAAPDEAAAYSATVSGVPEPANWGAWSLVGLLVYLASRARPSRHG